MNDTVTTGNTLVMNFWRGTLDARFLTSQRPWLPLSSYTPGAEPRGLGVTGTPLGHHDHVRFLGPARVACNSAGRRAAPARAQPSRVRATGGAPAHCHNPPSPASHVRNRVLFGHATVALATPASLWPRQRSFHARFVDYLDVHVAKVAGPDPPAEAGVTLVTSVTKPMAPAARVVPASETTIRLSRRPAWTPSPRRSSTR